MLKFFTALYGQYENADASLFEINTLFKTSDHLVMAEDAKVKIDDNEAIRYPSGDASISLNDEKGSDIWEVNKTWEFENILEIEKQMVGRNLI